MPSVSVAAVFLFGSLCAALVPDFPLATPIQDPLYQGVGWSPKPTRAPVVPRELLDRRDFLASSASFILVAPDQTCGYVGGLAGAYFQCGASPTKCVYFPVTGSSNFGAVGCCVDPLNCGFRTACVDSSTFHGSGCNGACQLDGYTMKCTESSAPYCGSIRYAYPSASVEQYFCGTDSASTWQTAFTTYSGQTDNRSFTQLARADLLSSSASLSSKSAASAASKSSTSTSSSSSSSTSSSSTSSPVSPSTSGATTTAASTGSSTNTGAIAGGVVGGVAGLALILAGAFFLYRRSAAKKNTTAAAPAAAPMADTTTSKPWQSQDGYYAPGGPGQQQGHQEGYYTPGQQPNQQYTTAYGAQYVPVPVEMPSDYVQRPAEAPVVHEASANTPISGHLSAPSDQQQFSSPASTYNSMSSPGSAYNRPLSEMDSTPPSHR